MAYRLTDDKDERFYMIGTLDEVADFLTYPRGLEENELRYRLSRDSRYNNDYVAYRFKKTGIHVKDLEYDAFVADVRDIMQGLAVIDLFEWEDEGNEVYTPGSYDVVDDDENSLIHRS